jgi:inosose dehydratase
MPTRRRFLRWAGVGAAATLVARSGFAEDSARAKPPAKRTFRLGVHTWTFSQLPLDQALAMTKRLGLKHISMSLHLPDDSKPKQIAETVAKVKAAGLDLYGDGVIAMDSSSDVERAFTFAKLAGLRIIIGRPTPEMLPLVSEKARKYDICVAIHNHGPGDNLYPVPEIAYEKIKQLDRRVGLCLDIGHAVRAGGDPSREAEQFADRLLDVHLKDVTAATENGMAVEIGRGVIDIPRFLRTLDRIRYAGVVSFEFEKDPGDPLPGLAESVGYVRGVLAVI